ncbi:MAG: DUF4405 domain-containing protein [Proteobacteria bacterium]|nr:DUF4405 domain-containing protein [Pseudomonadota bacterium]
MKQNTRITNIGLIIVSLTTILTGFVIQLRYHMDRLPPTAETWGLAYDSWSSLHKLSIVVFSLLTLFHVIAHWKWYKTVVIKKLFAKNKQTIILSVIFIITAVTGYIAWFAGLANGGASSDTMLFRKAFIEIHDKIAILLTIYIVGHIIKRMKRI